MATKPKLLADGATGQVAIFTIDDSDPEDRDPLDSPLSHLDRLLFHSDLDYPVIVSKHTGSLALPSRGANQPLVLSTYNLFAHGLPGQPLVFGRLLGLSANPVPLSGSVCVQTEGLGFGRWVHLGANSTNVIMTENSLSHRFYGLSGFSLSWEVWLTNFLLDAASPLPTPTDEMLFMSPTAFRTGGGKFDTSKRYIRSAATGKEFAMIQGRSVSKRPNGATSTSVWRYSVDGYVQQHTTFDGGNLGMQSMSTMSFNATIKDARTK